MTDDAGTKYRRRALLPALPPTSRGPNEAGAGAGSSTGPTGAEAEIN